MRCNMKILMIIGTRPQIIKASVLYDALTERGIKPILVHTGQHYDARLSGDLFAELGLREPNYNLEVGSVSDRSQIEIGFRKILTVIERERPDQILTIGDSNPVL